MPFHVFCYLGQNEQNKKVVNHLAVTKWLTKITGSRANGNFPTKPGEKIHCEFFSPFLERPFFFLVSYSNNSDHYHSAYSRSRGDQENASINTFENARLNVTRNGVRYKH